MTMEIVMTAARPLPLQMFGRCLGCRRHLVTDDKILTARAQAAVAELRASGIIFTIISSRPPRGMRMLIEPLGHHDARSAASMAA